MTAKELHELVKDVPKEAWPGVAYFRFGEKADWLLDEDRPEWPPWSNKLQEGAVVLMFEASMTRWLVGEGFHSFEWGNGESPTVTLDLYDHHFENKSERDSLVKLLAAACKDVAQENSK